MKEIIYLDTSFLHSFIAQTNEGLPTSMVKEFLEQQSDTSMDATSKEGSHDIGGKISTGSINIPLLLASPSGEGAYKSLIKSKIDNSITLSQLEAGKEIISKQLHDNALIDFENYLESKQLYNTDENFDESQLGKFIKITDAFKIFDLNYIKSLYNTDLMTEILSFDLSNPVMQHNPRKGKNGTTLTRRIDPSTASALKLFELILKYLTIILPSSLCFKQGKYFSPLKDEFIRGSNRELIFKYGTKSSLKITMIGRTTQIFNEFDTNMFDEMSSLTGLSSGLNSMIQQYLKEFQLIKKGDIIVSPVAIYFE